MRLPRPEELLRTVIDACRHRTDAVFYDTGTNPFSLSLGEKQIALFIANVTQSSGRAANEYRIQCPGSLPGDLLAHKASGRDVCVLGYSWQPEIFTAWDPQLILERSQGTQRFSLYTRRSSLIRAIESGFGLYQDSANQHVLSFRPEFLETYLANTNIMHLAKERSLINLANAFQAHESGQDTKKLVTVAKRKIDVTRRQYVRDRRFREAVLDAYNNRCAMCGLQLELVEAAHLVPHAHPEGQDIVVNGIALCTLHHKSLDDGLVFVDTSYDLHVNRSQVTHLRRVQKEEGIRRFTRQLRPSILLPENPNNVPSQEFIKRGNQIRGIDLS